MLKPTVYMYLILGYIIITILRVQVSMVVSTRFIYRAAGSIDYRIQGLETVKITELIRM